MVLSVTGVAVIGGAGLATVGLGGGGGPTAAHSSLPLATAPIERTTLVETKKVGGTLGYGSTKTASGGGARGTLTWLAKPGTVVSRGQSAYKVDNHPVPLLYGSLPLYRTLDTGTKGADIRQFERNLAALGYTGFTIDETFSSATAAAVKRWQDDLGVDETGKVAPGSVLITRGVIRVAERKAHVGDKAGQPVFTYTGTTRLVSVKLNVEFQRLAKKGAQVSIELPEGETTKGTVTKVGKVATEGQGEDPTTIKVSVSVSKQKSLGSYDKAPVEVRLTANRHKGVLAVPIAALLARPGGTYAVQVTSGSAVRTVDVETGVFSEGKVEISGSGLAEGMKVGVPT